MPLVTLKDVTEFAQKRNCGIGMFNVANLEFATAIVDAAEEANFPVIVGMAEKFFQFYSMQTMAEICISLANRAKVPVVVHLDHGENFETIMKALKIGFTSVMYDSSALTYEENIKNTAEIVRIAHSMGASVEGEIGYVGRDIDFTKPEHLTDPEQAYDYVSRTNVDAISVSIGNIHGNYGVKRRIDFQRIADIRKKVDCGLAVHGGSGFSDEEYVKIIKLGITKVNIYTKMSNFMIDSVRKKISSYNAWLDLTRDLRLSLQALVKEHIVLFSCTEAISD